MIYTLTVNPSLDYIVDIEHFDEGKVNRTKSEILNPGGKGINVSIVLTNLGLENKALGFTAGFTGKQIEDMLCAKNVKSDFIHINKGFSRINVKMRAQEESEINGRGPEITKADLDLLFARLEKLNQDDILVLAGSIPVDLPKTFYSDIMKALSPKGVKFVVDATGDLLKKSLEFKPFMVKPNNHELGEIFGVELKTKEDVAPYAQKFREMGAQNVLVSMAGQGALLAAADGNIYQGPAPQGKLINSVGAGDSMVAGFITGYLQSKSYKDALKMGLCTGSASACSEELATKEVVDTFLKNYNSL